jgi:hypothetical protein
LTSIQYAKTQVALHEQQHNSGNVLDYLRTVFHETAVHIEHSKYKEVRFVADVEKGVHQEPKKDNENYYLGQSWRRQWQMKQRQQRQRTWQRHLQRDQHAQSASPLSTWQHQRPPRRTRASRSLGRAPPRR